MAYAAITCIYPDGTEPSDGTLQRVAEQQDIRWPSGDGGTITLQILSEDGSLFDLTDATITLACRHRGTDRTPVMACQATISGPGAAAITVPPSSSARLAIGHVYLYEVTVERDGDAVQVLPPSRWTSTYQITRGGDSPPP